MTEAGLVELEQAPPECKVLRTYEEAVASPQHAFDVPVAVATIDADRRAAEWVLRVGGTLRVKVDGVERPVAKAEQLPARDFRVAEIDRYSVVFTKGARLDMLTGLSELRWLRFFGTQLCDAGFKSLTNLPKPDYLQLDFTRVTDAGMEHLDRALPSVRKLRLSSCPITDEGVA